MQAFSLPGTIEVFGAPAGEQLVSRPYFVREGLFDHVDVCFAPHVGARFAAGHGIMQSALISAMFTFHGESAHAGTAPWKARDALDAVVLMDVGMAELREHMLPNTQCQRVIVHGGDQPNVVPRMAKIWWYFRAAHAEGAQKLFERARQVAEGAALMTATTSAVEILSAVWPVRCNQVLSELVERECDRVGMPNWSEEEEALARSLQVAAGTKPAGLAKDIAKSRGPAVQKPSANDSGDVSWKVPMAKFYFPSNIPDIDFHHWAAGVALATSIAHKGAVAGARVLSGAVLECLTQPDLVDSARAGFMREIGEVQYKSLLPDDQRPPVEMNRAAMDKFRNLMKVHYLSRRPLFS
jgi:aminobenzoyl-glutamate utilization protein B